MVLPASCDVVLKGNLSVLVKHGGDLPVSCTRSHLKLVNIKLISFSKGYTIILKSSI